MPVNDQSAAIPYFPAITYPANTIGAALQAGAVGAPVNSPTFTGDPKAPTPAAADNDTSIATTAFVKTAIAGVAIADGDKGSITVSGSGTVWTLDDQAVTLAKLVNATAQYRMLMRTSAGAGPFQEVQGSADVLTMLQAASFAAARTALGLGALATQALVDNADWDGAGLALAVANGGTGQKTVPLARLGLAGSWTILTDGATISTDCSVNDRFTVTLAGTPRTLANPTNIIDGADYRWRLVQDVTGGRPLTLGSAFNLVSGATFAISSAANSVSYLSGIGRGAKIDVVATVGFPGLMFQAPFLFQQATGGGAALAAPVMSNRLALLKADTNLWGQDGVGVYTAAYTSGNGNVVFFGCGRSNAATTRLMGSDWNGDAMAPSARAKQDAAMNLSCASTLKAGGTIGAGTLHVQITPTEATPRFKFLLGWLFDLDQVNGGIGAANAAVIAVSQLFVEVSLAVTQAGSLLVAAAWNQEEGARPFVWSPGWTKLDEQFLGAGDQPAGSLASKISTATGSETVRMTGDLASSQWAIVAVEFLKG